MRGASSWSVTVGVPVILAGVIQASCADRPAGARLPTESSARAVFGGHDATTCQYPSTVLLAGCTGTLVHPQVVITAAHCGTGHKTATFGETRTGPRKVPIELCRRIGDGANAADDYAFCKLAMPVTDVPIAPPLMGCEVDQLKPGRPVVLAGFGDADDDGNGFGRKRWLATVFNKIQRGAANVGGKGVGSCYGDSGGPAFVKLDDGSWRSFGIVSEGLGESCGAGDLMAFMHTAVPWIEKTAGIDITPCHDADGTWNPGPTCRGFALEMGREGRSWDNGCAEPVLSPPAATCGAAYAGTAAMPDAGGSVDAGAGPGVGAPGSGGARGETVDARADQAAGTGGSPARGSGGSASGGTGGNAISGSASGGTTGSGGRPAPGPTSPATGNTNQVAGGCSMGGPARAEGGMALLAAIAFAMAFILRRRWFPRATVVDDAGKTHAGPYADVD